MIFTEVIKLLKKDPGPGLKFYLTLSSSTNLFEKLFLTALNLDSVFLDDTKQAELIGQLTICIMFASKLGAYKKIDEFLMQQLTNPSDLKALYLTMNCFQSVARVCNQITCLAYFKRFTKMYRNSRSMSCAQIYALKLLSKAFYACLPKKLKVAYLSKNPVLSRPVKVFSLGLQLIDPETVKEVESQILRLVQGFPGSGDDYQKLVSQRLD